MANPQVEDGYVKVAKELAVALSRINLSAYESRILWCIFDKTYGWGKKTDRISYSQFEETTHLSHRHIGLTLKLLLDRNLIIRSGEGQVLGYGIQKDYAQWTYIKNSHHKPVPKGALVNPASTSTEGRTSEPVPKGGPTSTEGRTETSTEGRTYINNKHITEAVTRSPALQKRIETFENYQESLRIRFTDIAFDHELEQFNLYYSEGDRKLKRPKLALLKWMTKAREFQEQEKKVAAPAKNGWGIPSADKTKKEKPL